jgi:hypothetical protein
MSSQNAWRPVDAASETLNLAASFRWREHREGFPRAAAALDFVFRALSSSEFFSDYSRIRAQLC